MSILQKEHNAEFGIFRRSHLFKFHLSMQKREVYVSETTFRSVDYTRQSLRGWEFEACIFTDCDFSYADLTGCLFDGCQFESCRLALVTMADTVWRDVFFKKCSLTGLDFEKCSTFGFSIRCEASVVNNCAFVRREMKGTLFRLGELRECFFAECDLGRSVFDNCVMAETTFERCDLRGADFRTAIGYVINPHENRVAGARFSEHNLTGLVLPFNVTIE